MIFSAHKNFDDCSVIFGWNKELNQKKLKFKKFVLKQFLSRFVFQLYDKVAYFDKIIDFL